MDSIDRKELDIVSQNHKRKNENPTVPSWIKRLANLGISASSTRIEFLEVVRCKSDRPILLSREHPTVLKCCLTITQDQRTAKRLVFVGEPCASRKEALESASLNVEKEFLICTDPDVLRPKQSLQIQCNRNFIKDWNSQISKVSTHVSPLLSCFTTDFARSRSTSNGSSKHQPSMSQSWYMYEFKFTINNTNQSLASRLGFLDDYATPFGILFAEDIEPSQHKASALFAKSHSPELKGRFTIPALKENEKISIHLIKRTLVKPSSITAQQMELLLSFNRRIPEWQSYGVQNATGMFHKPMKPFDAAAPPSQTSRTYLLAPLLQKNWLRRRNASIDWNLLYRITSHQKTPMISWSLYPFITTCVCLCMGAVKIAAARGLQKLSLGTILKPKHQYLYIGGCVYFIGRAATAQVVTKQRKLVVNSYLWNFAISVIDTVKFPRYISKKVLKHHFFKQRIDDNCLRNQIYILNDTIKSDNLTTRSLFNIREHSMMEVNNIVNNNYKNVAKADMKISLMKRYQSLHRINLKSKKDFREKSFQFGNSLLWRSFFTCPVSGKVYASKAEGDSEPTDFEMHEQCAYFKTKKAAQTSACRAALEHLESIKPTNMKCTETQQQQKTTSSVSKRNTTNKVDVGFLQSPITYGEYYQKMYNVRYRIKQDFLLPAYGGQQKYSFRHNDYDSTKRNINEIELDENIGKYNLIPELVDVLPMPRDFLYMLQYQSNFMIPLERAIQISHVEARFLELAKEAPTFRTEKIRCVSREIKCSRRPLSSFLYDAICFVPSKEQHQRLEFVGDSVLAFYTAVNIFSRNSGLKWDIDDFECMKARAISNVALCECAQSCGINKIIITAATKWEWAYNQNTKKLKPDAYYSGPISDKTSSDVVEALLGAIHVGCDPEIRTHMTVGFLNELNTPLPFPDGFFVGNQWFTAKGACLNSGYPFSLDSRWLAQLSTIQRIINSNSELVLKLNSGQQALLQILFKISSMDLVVNDHIHILINAALYDYDPADIPGEDNFIQVAILRDTLFTVGDAALQCALTEDLYWRFPGASEGDISLLRHCASTDDVIVYVMIKHGFHDCLYDAGAYEIKEFKDLMRLSDFVGTELWEENGGWILPGGANEYNCRCSKPMKGSQPKYIGLVGGRLLCAEREKVPKKITEDLKFSMKSIIGSLTLAFGIEHVWKYMLYPIFEELLLLTPYELRNVGSKYSSVCTSHTSSTKVSNIS